MSSSRESSQPRDLIQVSCIAGRFGRWQISIPYETKWLSMPDQSCPTLCDPMDCSRQSLLSMRFSRQEYWSGLHAFLQGILPIQGLNQCLLWLLGWQADSFTTEPPGKLFWMPLFSKEYREQNSNQRDFYTMSCKELRRLTLEKASLGGALILVLKYGKGHVVSRQWGQL